MEAQTSHRLLAKTQTSLLASASMQNRLCYSIGLSSSPCLDPVRHRPLSRDRNFRDWLNRSSCEREKTQLAHPSTSFFSRSMVLGKKEKGGAMARVVDDKPGERQAGAKTSGKVREPG